jgi:hypothetical protein
MDFCHNFSVPPNFFFKASDGAMCAAFREAAPQSGHRGIHAALLKKCAKPAPPQPLGSAIVLQWWLFFDLSFHA